MGNRCALLVRCVPWTKPEPAASNRSWSAPWQKTIALRDRRSQRERVNQLCASPASRGFRARTSSRRAAGRFATVANRFVTLANRLVMLANRLVMLANRFVMLADRFVMLADRFVTLADRFAKVASAPVEASLETFISFRISAAFSFQDLAKSNPNSLDGPRSHLSGARRACGVRPWIRPVSRTQLRVSRLAYVARRERDTSELASRLRSVSVASCSDFARPSTGFGVEMAACVDPSVR